MNKHDRYIPLSHKCEIDFKNIDIYELRHIKHILNKNNIDFRYDYNKENEFLYTNFMRHFDNNIIIKMSSVLQNISQSDFNLFKKYFDTEISRLKTCSNILNDFNILNKNTKRFKKSASVSFDIFGKRMYIKYSPIKNPYINPVEFPYSKIINSLNSECKKIVLKYFPFVIQDVKKPTDELLKVALLNSDKDVIELVFKDITLPEKLQILGIENNKFTNIYDIKDITPNARLLFIHMHPELINLKIEELNDKELKIYNKRMEEYNINLVKKDYKNIEKISNPSKTVRDIAINEFRKKWER